MKNKKWSENQIQILKEKYAFETWNDLEEKLYPFTKSEITGKANSLNLKRQNFFYSQEQIDFLKTNYHKYSNKELSKILGKTPSSIASKANSLNISYSDEWTENEINILKEEYAHKSNKNIEKILHRNSEAIGMKARELGLKKEKFTYYDFDEFILNLKSFALSLNRTPFYHEVVSQEWSPSSMSINRYFGGYRQACELANLDVNINIFGSSKPAYKSKSGDLCWSKAELIITNFLIENNIEYKKEVLYSDYIKDERCKTKKFDWVIDDKIFIEYFGMMDKEYYKIKAELKIKLCEDHNIQLISLFEKNLKNLKKIFEDYYT